MPTWMPRLVRKAKKMRTATKASDNDGNESMISSESEDSNDASQSSPNDSGVDVQECGSSAPGDEENHSSCDSDDAVGDSDDVGDDYGSVDGDSDEESTRTERDIRKFKGAPWVKCHRCCQWRMLPPGTSDDFVKNIPYPWFCRNK